MADEEPIAQLITQLTNAKRQGTHVSAGAIRILIPALRLYAAARAVIERRHSDLYDGTPRRKPEPYTGPPATIGSLRQHGLLGISVTCTAPNCWHVGHATFAALSLDDTTLFPDIAARRGFRCHKCGCRRVRIMPDWTDLEAQGVPKPPPDYSVT